MLRVLVNRPSLRGRETSFTDGKPKVVQDVIVNCGRYLPVINDVMYFGRIVSSEMTNVGAAAPEDTLP